MGSVRRLDGSGAVVRCRSPGCSLGGRPASRALCFAALFGILLASQGLFCAVQARELRVAVVDTREILNLSTAVKEVNRVIEQERNGFQDAFKAKEQKLVERSRELVAQKSVLDPVVFAQRKADIDKESAIARRQAKQLKQELNGLYAQSLAIVKAKMQEIVQKIASERRLDLLLDRRSVVFFRPDLEITDQVVLELNEQIPFVVVKTDTIEE